MNIDALQQGASQFEQQARKYYKLMKLNYYSMANF